MSILKPADESQVKEVLLHYKKFYLSLGIIVVCISLFFLVIIPQVQQYFDQNSRVQDAENRVNTLQRNITLLSQINDEQQSKELKAALQALPEEKAYAGVLFAIRSASSKSGVGIGDFSFSIGELSAKNAISQKTLFIATTINVLGDAAGLSSFLTELSNTLPLSNVAEIHMNVNLSNVIVYFYYKPIPQLRVNYTQPLLSISGSNKTLLDSLSKIEIDEVGLFIPHSQSGSSSASPF
jgi:hypothetical protein